VSCPFGLTVALAALRTTPEWRSFISDKWVIARNTVAAAGAKFLQLAASFVFMPFLIRNFGLAHYGVFIIAGSLSVYLQLLDFGVDSATTKYVAEYHARHDRPGLHRLISNALAYYVFVGMVAAALLALLALAGIPLLDLTFSDASLARNLFLIAGAIALFTWSLNTGTIVLNGLQRYDITARVSAGVTIGNIAVTAAALALGEGPAVLLALQGGVAVLGALTNTVLALRELDGIRPSAQLVDRDTLGMLLRFGVKLFALQVSVMLSSQQTDRLVLLIFRSPAAVSLYEAPSKVSGLMTHIVGLPSAALVPAASQLDAEERAGHLRALFLRGTKYTIAFTAPVAVAFAVVAKPLLLRWLGTDFVGQALACQLFLVGWLFHANLQVATAILIGTERVGFLLRWAVGVAVLNVAISLALVGPLGVLGVVIGSVVADLVLFPLIMRHVLRTLDTSLGDYVRRVVTPSYPFALVSGAAALALAAAGLTGSLLGVAVTVAVAVIAAWAAFYAFGLDPNERLDAREFARRLTSHAA